MTIIAGKRFLLFLFTCLVIIVILVVKENIILPTFDRVPCVQTPETRVHRPAISVTSSGNLTHRVHIMNDYLTQLRQLIWKERTTRDWQYNVSCHLSVVHGENDFIDNLVDRANINIVLLPWINWTNKVLKSKRRGVIRKSRNLIVQKYYISTADDMLCTWLETPGINNNPYDLFHNRTCVRDMSQSVTATSLHPSYLKIGLPADWDKSYPLWRYVKPPTWVLYLSVITDGIITQSGEVFSGSLKIVPTECGADLSPTPPRNIHKLPLYDEVFTIAQYWGTEVFHGMVEVVLRIAPFVEFLQQNPWIRILVSEKSRILTELLDRLGIREHRIISGIVRAKVVYLPRSTDCGFVNPPEIQILSRLYRDYIKQNFPVQIQNKVVLIRRSYSRRFTEQYEIEKQVKLAAAEFNLEFVVFKDKPVPSLNETMKLFNSAVMVVGPHGAGLSNTIFSEPGTYVVEGVCNIPHVNLCFQHLAHVLGHHSHGVPSRKGCLDVVDAPATNIINAVRTFLTMRSTNNN